MFYVFIKFVTSFTSVLLLTRTVRLLKQEDNKQNKTTCPEKRLKVIVTCVWCEQKQRASVNERTSMNGSSWTLHDFVLCWVIWSVQLKDYLSFPTSTIETNTAVSSTVCVSLKNKSFLFYFYRSRLAVSRHLGGPELLSYLCGIISVAENVVYCAVTKSEYYAMCIANQQWCHE